MKPFQKDWLVQLSYTSYLIFRRLSLGQITYYSPQNVTVAQKAATPLPDIYTPTCNENTWPHKNRCSAIRKSKVETAQMGPSFDKGINKRGLAINRKEMKHWIHATSQTTLKILMLSERSQSQKSTYSMTSST